MSIYFSTLCLKQVKEVKQSNLFFSDVVYDSHWGHGNGCKLESQSQPRHECVNKLEAAAINFLFLIKLWNVPLCSAAVTCNQLAIITALLSAPGS